jgi:cytoskeleton protein RodZ
MRQKIDITDVETATKIRAKYLRALENEEFDLLHGGTFVRSFLRTYAQYLGLDAQRLIEEYRIHHEPRDEVEFQHIAPVPQGRREPPRGGRGGGPPRRGTLLALVVVGVLAFLLVLGLAGGDEEDGGDEAPERAATQPREERRQEAPAARDEEQRPAAPRRVRVRVTPSTPVYVCWDRGPDTEPTELSALAEARTFRGRRIRLNIGNPSARLSVNGRRVGLEGAGPFGFDVRPGRVREIPVGQRPCA